MLAMNVSAIDIVLSFPFLFARLFFMTALVIQQQQPVPWPALEISVRRECPSATAYLALELPASPFTVTHAVVKLSNGEACYSRPIHCPILLSFLLVLFLFLLFLFRFVWLISVCEEHHTIRTSIVEVQDRIVPTNSSTPVLIQCMPHVPIAA